MPDLQVQSHSGSGTMTPGWGLRLVFWVGPCLQSQGRPQCLAQCLLRLLACNKGCLHACWAEGFTQDVWHGSHLKELSAKIKHQGRKQKTLWYHCCFPLDPGNYCVIFTAALWTYQPISQFVGHQASAREPGALQTWWLRLELTLSNLHIQAIFMVAFSANRPRWVGIALCSCLTVWDKTHVPRSVLPDGCKNQVAENGFPLPTSSDRAGGDEKGSVNP